jgi:hypothetical protein
MAKATFYVQVEPIWSRVIRADGEHYLTSIKAERITKSRPARPLPGSVTVKLTLDIPNAAFYPLRPEVVVVVPDSLVQANPIRVEVEDPQ